MRESLMVPPQAIDGVDAALDAVKRQIAAMSLQGWLNPRIIITEKDGNTSLKLIMDPPPGDLNHPSEESN